MPDARYDLGRALHLGADAIGEPGGRRFRVVIEAERGVAHLWLEKEQLFQLALSIKGLLQSIDSPVQREAEPPERTSTGVALDFQVAKLALGSDPAGEYLLLAAHDAESADAEDPTVVAFGVQERFRELADEAFDVCAAGRPLCPLCSSPLNPGEPHRCARTNGTVAL